MIQFPSFNHKLKKKKKKKKKHHQPECLKCNKI